MTFRHPSLLARMAAQIDQLSGGRFILGMGAGWNVAEHQAFGLPFPELQRAYGPTRGRRSGRPGPLGRRARHLRWHPLPARQRRSATRSRLSRTTAAAHRWPRRTPHAPHRRPATPTNGTSLESNLPEYQRLAGVLANHCADVGRDPAAIRHSQMSCPDHRSRSGRSYTPTSRASLRRSRPLVNRPVEEMLPANGRSAAGSSALRIGDRR